MHIENADVRPFAAKFVQEFRGKQAISGHYDAAKQQRSWPNEARSGSYPTMFPTHCGQGQIDDERAGD